MISLVIVDKMKLEWILIAKGIGTFLVVAGHFWPVDSPSYWTEVRRIIYTFHMPLFFSYQACCISMASIHTGNYYPPKSNAYCFRLLQLQSSFL